MSHFLFTVGVFFNNIFNKRHINTVLARHICHSHSVFRKTTAAVSGAGVQKAVADTSVESHTFGDLADVSA